MSKRLRIHGIPSVYRGVNMRSLLGLFGEPDLVAGEREWRWGEARIFRCLSCNHVSVLAASGSWHCRICGAGPGNAHVGAFCVDAEERFEDIWARASNRVQWRPNT
jgi:hypothetical protein